MCASVTVIGLLATSSADSSAALRAARRSSSFMNEAVTPSVRLITVSGSESSSRSLPW